MMASNIDANQYEKEPYLVDIFGSCVSRVPFLEGNLTATGCVDPRIKINYFYDRHPILSCMTPVPSTKILNPDSIEKISKEELYNKSDRNIRSVKQELLKSTLPLLKESKAEFLIFDLYSFHTNLFVYDDTMFSPYSYEFFNTEIYKKNPSDFSQMLFLLDIPLGLWWGYVKSFFDIVFNKFGNGKVIMLRFTACSHYLSKEKQILPIPERCKRPWMANHKYNKKLRELEDKIIALYNPHVIDYSKFYIGDEELYAGDLQGAHFSKEYYIESFKKIKEIIFATSRNAEEKQIFKCDYLSLKGTADILKKPLSQDEFIKMWSQIASPVQALKGNRTVEKIAMLSDAKIIYNRFLLGDILELIEQLSYVYENPLFTEKEKKYILQKNISFWDREFTEKEKVFLKEFFQDTEKEFTFINEAEAPYSFDVIFEKFLLLFEQENLVWIDYLMRAGQLEPYNKEVLQYLIAYAEAIGDTDLLEEYEHRLIEADTIN